MYQKIIKFIEKHNLLEHGDRIVVGVSGGADSVCLLHVLNCLRERYNLSLYVVHVNHGIRGLHADEDEAFVRELCAKLGLHFYAVFHNVPEISKREGISSEEAGRNIRYDTFYQESLKYQCNKIAIAHNMNDNAETVLFHLIRGTGIKGLTGITAKRNLSETIQIIRPLLCIERDEIETYLSKNQWQYRVDASNFTDEYSRNRLRNHIIPFMKHEVNEGVIPHIFETSKQLEEISNYLEVKTEEAYEKLLLLNGDFEIPISEFLKEDIVIQKGVIRKVLYQLAGQLKDLEARHVDLILHLAKKPVGKRIHMPHGIVVEKGYDHIKFFLEKDKKEDTTADWEGICITLQPEVTKEYELPLPWKKLICSVIDYKKNMSIPKNAYTKWFDYDKIKNTLLIRTRRQGDCIQINQDGGKKKLKDLFIDLKIPKEERDQILLLADGSHIAWAFDVRMSEAYKVNEDTKRVLVITLIGGNSSER